MRYVLLVALLLPGNILLSQTIKGKIFGQNDGGKEILPGATVQWLGTATGAAANENGVFELPVEGITDKRIIARMAGYLPDTIPVADKAYLSIVLRRDPKQLNEVTVTDRSNIVVSGIEIGKTEIINQKELTKAACCDLAGCFGTQASVQPQTTNVITNAQELRILGLSGVYNQVLVDGMPMIQGLSYTYGISSYPGSIINNIYVSKGATSVLQGYESISGQVNLDSKQPDKTDKLYLNGYVNSFAEKHLNANWAAAFGKAKKWSAMLALHVVQPANRIDGNDDGFMDLPLLTRYVAYNKWKYGNDKGNGFSFQGGVRVVNEKRVGGQVGYNETADEGSTKVYGQTVKYNQQEVFAKPVYRFSDNHAVAIAVSGFTHHQSSWFGTTAYNAVQQNAYFNMQHEWLWKDKHLLKYGLSYRYQQLEESIHFADSSLGRTYAGNYVTSLRVPGLFAENAFHWKNDKLVLVTGARVDKHQLFGTRFTPRAMLKYRINSLHTFRASAGSGWRQVNLFSEQVNLLTSSRDIIFAEALKPEEAYNWGISHTYRFVSGRTSGTISVDFYSTRFIRQFFPDYDTDPTKAIIRNFEGVSRSNGFQFDASFTFFRRLDVRAAYNYLDVYRIYNEVKVNLPFNAKNRVMSAVSYRTSNSKWQGDVIVHWFDKMRLPDTRSNPAPYARPLFSTPYLTLNIQITYKWKSVDIYGGCENLANYRQPNPIISAENPFGKYFDISSVWGPTRGREIYIGVRYALK